MKCAHVGCLMLALAVVGGQVAHAQDQTVAAPHVAPPRISGQVIDSYPPSAMPLRDNLVEDIVPPSPNDPADPLQFDVTLPDWGLVTLQLTPVSVRAPGYTLRTQNGDGRLDLVDPGPEHTYTGHVVDFPESTVAASVTGLEVLAMVRLASGRSYWIQPYRDMAASTDREWSGRPSMHLVYRGGDTLCSGGCNGPGVERNVSTNDDAPVPHGGCGTDAIPCIAELAIDADFEYFQARGASTFAVQDRISAIINVVNHQFQRDVFITHRLQDVVVRISEPDPYSAAGANDLLNQVKTEWLGNQGGTLRDLVQLFTGRDLTGSDTGAAFDAAVCDNDFHYSVVQSDFSPLFACVTDNSAHFLGHLWGATHCDCPESTMNATLSCANTFGGAGSTSLTEITGFLESATCLSTGGFTPPNDRCDQATVVTTSGTYFGNNTGASNDGSVTALSCGGTQGGGGRDIFWTFTPAASGPLSVSTCGTPFPFDTLLSVHSGCPASPANMVICNDDCGCFLGSCFTFNASAGQTYYARVSGVFAHNVGNITFNITLPAAPACAGDLDCDNDRDADDIPHFVQAVIDPAGYAADHPGCDVNRANLNADADIDGRDIAAFTALLIAGACP